MNEITKTKLEAVAMLVYLLIAVIATAGAISTLEGIYIVAGVANLLCAAYSVYKKVINNAR